MRTINLLFLIFFLFLNGGLRRVQAQTLSSYYLSSSVSYNPKIPTPETLLGYVPGEKHVSHDQLFYYAKSIAEQSPRIHFEVFGKTHEGRPLSLLIITSEENQKRLAEIKAAHQKLVDPATAASVDIDKQPVFIWLGHSIHGNEASGSNSALLTIYHLAAAQGPEIEKWLKDAVIFIDPSENPDGLQRFSTWVNAHRWSTFNDDPQTREHAEAWPGGRTNHYWFDLNRDWLPLQQPESQARIAKLQEWKPNIFIDLHEQGTNATFHFSPGEPNRVHPLIPAENQELTEKIAVYHARGFDAIGTLYTSKEGYDDYYNGRGPTYVDFNGGVAMLFEQASSRGYAQQSDNGVVTFPQGVRNQFTGSLSTIKAGVALRKELLAYQRKYYETALAEAGKDAVKAFVFGSAYDKASTYHLAEVLHRHGVNVYRLKEDKVINHQRFQSNASYIVPLAQPQYRLIQSIFEKRTSFKDSLFYDISGWTFPLAFNQDLEQLNAATYNKSLLGPLFELNHVPSGKVEGGISQYAYAFDWGSYYAPKALYALMEKGVIAKAASKPFTIPGGPAFTRGTILISVANQTIHPEDLYDLLKKIAAESMGVTFYAIHSGSTVEGTHLGSNTFQRVQKPSVCILGGGRMDGVSVGQLWHLLDQRYKIPGAIIPVETVAGADISRYNTLVLVDGDYSSLPETFIPKLKAWVEGGGVIVGYERALNFLDKAGLLKLDYAKQKSEGSGVYQDYVLSQRAAGIPGSIVEITADLTHPLFYGYAKSTIPYWKSTELVIKDSALGKYNYPAKFSAHPLLSGYLPKNFPALLSKAPAVAVKTVGNGRIIAFTDDTNFRAFWYGTNKLLANSLFFGRLINAGTGR